jgi:uncharacterized protein (TIGR03086 family)
MTSEQRVFILADEALTKVVDQIKDDQWDMPMPDWFPVGRTQENMTLRTIINYHVYDEAWVPDVLDGKSKREVGTKYDGDLLGDDPKASWHKYYDKAVEAVKNAADMTKVVHMSYGDYPAGEYLTHITSFRGFRAYDIAKLIGVDPTLDPELVQGMWDAFSPHAEEWRAMGVFKEAVPVPDDAPLQDKLLAMTGRDPRA